MARISQDVTSVDADQRDFDPLPAGNYMAQIIESDLVNAKSGNGQILKMTFEILDGPYVNRRIWDQANIVHSNPTAQTIGQQRLKAICDAIGHSGQVDDSEELHNQPMMIRVAIEQRDANYAPRNAVKSIKAVETPTPASKPAAKAHPSTGNGVASAPTSRPTSRPWGNRSAAAPS